METILITGGAGFIGGNFLLYMVKKYPDIQFITLDSLSYAGNLQNLVTLSQAENHRFFQGDICDSALVGEIFAQYQPQGVVHFAAETHVDRSLHDPGIFVKTNVLGTQTLLEQAKKAWNPTHGVVIPPEARVGRKFLYISTDEVYGALGDSGFFQETSPLAPSSPYSASKASGDLLVQAYHRSFALPVNITRCSNNYGKFQHQEKLIPHMITQAMAGKSLPIYGDGFQVREWLHVSDHCRALEQVLFSGREGEVYNIGAQEERTNLSLVKEILSLLGQSEELLTFVADRPGHDRRYALDSRKITAELGWKPEISLETGLKDTVAWYVAQNNQV